jgi:hypothetical protein
MFVVSEAEAAAIRAAYEQRGELSAAVELRRAVPAQPRRGNARAYRGLEAAAEAAASSPASAQGHIRPGEVVLDA